MGVVKLLRAEAEQLSPRESARKKFMDGVLKRADKIAFEQDRAITAETKHLVYSLIYELSEAFLINNELVHALNNTSHGLEQLQADMEAMRRAISER